MRVVGAKEINMSAEPHTKEPECVGPYAIHDEIGSGGMATVHLGQLRSSSGFTRIVAIKRMHTELARSPEFVNMFLEEARLASRIQHPNVVAALDWIATDSAAFLIMEYVHGASLDQALRWTNETGKRVPLPVASALLIGTLLGLHAAHEAVDESGKNLGIVHRDVSPHNVLVGVDGLARVLDFGIAKAAERVQHTKTGEVKGKLGYIAPEQLFHDRIGREADIYSVGVMLWEIVVGRRLFANESQGQMLLRIANNQLDSPRSVNPDVSVEVEAVTMKALAPLPESRYRTALEFAIALETCIPPASQRIVGEWLASVGTEALQRRSELKLRIEGTTTGRLFDRVRAAEGDSAVHRAVKESVVNTAVGVSAPVVPPKSGRRGVALGVFAIGATAVAATAAAYLSHGPRPGSLPTAAATPVATAQQAEPVAPMADVSAASTAVSAATSSSESAAAKVDGAAAAESIAVNPASSAGPFGGHPDMSHGVDPRTRLAKPVVRSIGSTAPSASAPSRGEFDSIGGRE